MKPKISNVLRILKNKDQISKLYTENEKLINELLEEHSCERFDYDLSQLPMMDLDLHIFAHELLQSGGYLKFELIDIAEKLQSGEKVFAPAYINAITFSSGTLKRKPESLKGVE